MAPGECLYRTCILPALFGVAASSAFLRGSHGYQYRMLVSIVKADRSTNAASFVHCRSRNPCFISVGHECQEGKRY